ncbi:inner centromere protein isoform X2 [Sarcophilus harrisii]|uniref:Inner centromere protein n=2 Tax=Sarcophilus harrisii TaxID=9305 RepID=G3VMA3_SARHA|nr:inner centromere protein isoform X2 [Sarcophilus harrisii]
MAKKWALGARSSLRPPVCGCRPAGGTMGPTMGSASILDLCGTKLMEFMCNVENKDMVWLQEIKEEALKMFSSDFSVEPELMPKTPSQKNRRRKKRFSSIQDENKPPSRKRLSRRANRRSSQLGRQLLRSKDRLEKLVLVVAENGSIPRGARGQPVGAPSLPESPTWLPKKSTTLPAVGGLVPVVEIGISEQRSAEKCLEASKARTAEQKLSFGGSGCEDELVPSKQAGGVLEAAPGTSLAAPAEGPQGKAARPARSVAKLRIARLASPKEAVTEPDGAPPSVVAQPQPEPAVEDLPESPRTPTGSRSDRRSVRRSLVRKSSQAHRVSLIHKYSMVPKRISSRRRSSRKQAQEPATGRIICHSYLERLLDVEIPGKASSEEEAEGATETDPEVVESTRRTLRPRNANKIAISTPKAQPESGGQAAGDSENKTGGSEEPREEPQEELREPPQSVRRKRSYKQAVSELDENGDHGDDEALTPPRNKTPSPVCPPSKVVRPLRTFLHTVQKNQMLMTPTSASRSSVMKSFIKRNTPLHMDAKEKERQRLENLKKKEEAELLRKQKVEEDKRRRLEEVKMKREERLRKVLQARERAEQLEVEKKKRIEQKLAQLEKNEKAKEERLAEEKARKKAAAKKLEEAEARRKQEEEARRQKRLQEEEERRFQEQLQKKKEEEQERLRKLAEARRIMEQQKQREQQLALEREMERKREQERLQAERERQEREKALRLQKERSQRELEEKRKREERQRQEQERQRQEQERKRLQEEQEKKAKEAAAAAAAATSAAAATPAMGTGSKFLNVTMDVQSPVCNSYEMTPQGPKGGPKINPDNYGMDLNSDDSTDDETQPRKPIPAWANGTQLSQAVIRQYYQPPDLDQLFGTILSPRLEDIFNKSKPRYHKRTSSAVWHSPPLPGSRPFVGLPYGLKKP